MERMVSPGVFTKENDQTFLPEGIAQIGAAFVGPFLKGPAFRPVVVRSTLDLEQQFGVTNPDFYTPHAAYSYLKQAGSATIVRVLGLSGYDSALAQSFRLTFGGQTAALLHPSRLGVTIASGSVTGSAINFALTISGSNGLKSFSGLSIDPSSPQYIAKILGTDPNTKYDAFVYAVFPAATSAQAGGLIGSGSVTGSVATGDLNLSGSVWGTWASAATPMIKSQLISGQRSSLFRFRTLSDGSAANTDVKVSIVGARPSSTVGEYGTFSVLVREFSDTDNKISVLEQFDNLTLDPTSPNFIAARIGTAHTIIDGNGDIYRDGDYPNASKYIYIEMDANADTIPVAALPYGFEPLSAPINRADVPAPQYVTTRYVTLAGTSTSIAKNGTYYGYSFADDTSVAYLKAIPSGSVNKVGVGDTGFYLDATLAGTDLVDVAPTTATALRKFTVPFQGGFDGINPSKIRNTGAAITSTNTMGFDLSDATKDGAKAYNLALTALANPEAYDINMLILPGVLYSQHPYVATQAIAVCENRGDCFYIMDAALLGDTADAAVNAVAGVDSSYVATYHPWVKIKGITTGKHLWVPPSVVMAGVFAFNDRVAGEFYAPAGMHRGGIGEAIAVRTRLNQAGRDTLYEGHVNPIAIFPGQGIAVWGQRTLQHQASALDRINVRRLLIMVKKFIASSSRYLVFEQNTEATRNRFLNLVNPYLSAVQERQGLYAFRVKMDSTNNPPDLIDRNILVGQLFLKPARSVEEIVLEFNVLPTGATFPN